MVGIFKPEVKHKKGEAMSPYQVMGIIACCTLIFAGVVAFLAMQGVHILQALMGVYLVVVVCMLAMQRRARESFEHRECRRQRRFDLESQLQRTNARDFRSLESTETAVSEH